MGSNVTGTIIKLVIWSIVIGAILWALDMQPQDLLSGIGGKAEAVFSAVVGVISWAIPFALAGAVVVVPVWLIARALSMARRRR